MNVDGRLMRTIWLAEDGQPRGAVVEIIDQTRLPHELVITRLARLVDAARSLAPVVLAGSFAPPLARVRRRAAAGCAA